MKELSSFSCILYSGLIKSFLMITDSQKQKINQYFRRQPVELVYFFGSHANGRPTPLSDYDFAVLFNRGLNRKTRFDLKLQFMADLGEILSTDKVEILDLDQAPASFRYSVLIPRQEIYVKSETERVDFEHQTMREYFDQIYYLRRHSMASLTSIAKEGLSL